MKLTLNILELQIKSLKKSLRCFNGSFETYTRYSGVADAEQKKGYRRFFAKSCSRHYEKIVYWDAQILFSLTTTYIYHNLNLILKAPYFINELLQHILNINENKIL